MAIIVVTFLIKLAFYKLTESSGRSMAKMRNLQPRMKALQDRYKDDKQALSQAMMELYKREKVNPAAGCLPILIQMPFFLAFYWVLLESVEMRQAPFALWITDLSTRDPFFILPLIMGAAMFSQQKAEPAPADPVQAKVMQIMPIMFTVFFAFFPSGLVLYWVTNTLLSIAQQWKINKVVEAEARQQRRQDRQERRLRAHDTDTIVAAATPPGTGGVGIVRLSGRRAERIRERMLGSLPEPRTATYRSFRTPPASASTPAWPCTFRHRHLSPASPCSSCTATAGRSSSPAR